MSSLSLLYCRFIAVACKHFPHVQKMVPISPHQKKAQSEHCLKWLISSDFSKSFSKIFLFGDFRIAQLIVELFLVDLSQVVQQQNVGCQGFENQYNI